MFLTADAGHVLKVITYVRWRVVLFVCRHISFHAVCLKCVETGCQMDCEEVVAIDRDVSVTFSFVPNQSSVVGMINTVGATVIVGDLCLMLRAQ
jgi:hypothetical protein